MTSVVVHSAGAVRDDGVERQPAVAWGNYNRPWGFWAGGVRSWAPGGALQGPVLRIARGALWAEKIEIESTGIGSVRRVLIAECVVHSC